MQALASWHRRALRAVMALAAAATTATACAQFRDSIPSRVYYVGIEQLYRGEYRDALRTFDRAWTGAIKTLQAGGQVRWVDSICYHAMMGETYFQWGQLDAALTQFDSACSLYLQNSRWMLRVQFDVAPRADATLARATPWGGSQRQATPGRFPETYAVARGQIDATAQLQQGGVVMQPQLWPVNVAEVMRCAALAIRRRNEILGPLGPYDQISKNMVLTLSRGGAPPNHWSNAWIDVLRGLAHAGVGETDQALEYLERGVLVGGQFDHPLTCIALLEQGRLAMDAANFAAASQLLAEASYAAFAYQDAGVIDDAFRISGVNRRAAGGGDVNPALVPAAAWARRERYDHIGSRINLSLAEELMAAGNWNDAAAALAAGIAQLRDARTGQLGNRAQYLDAKLDLWRGRESGEAKLLQALEVQSSMSLQNFQLALANSMFDAQTLPARSAPEVYELLLADPTPADSVLRLLESMAVMSTRHEEAFHRWLLAALERKNLGAVIEVTDRAKRRRLHNAMPWGGRLAALRSLLSAPSDSLDPRRQQQRSDLLAMFPGYATELEAANQVRGQLQRAWLPALDDEASRKVTELWKDYAAALDRSEARLKQVGLAPVPVETNFPPLLTAADLQSRLAPGQAVLVYHDSPEGLYGFLFTAKAATHWNCGPSGEVGADVAQFLRDLGNYDANREMTDEHLMSDEWHKSSAQLYATLLEGSSLSPSAMTELIVVPDGVTWYVPFEALLATSDDKTAPLISYAKVRYAPTVGLAFSFPGAWRRVQRTGLAIGELPPGDKPEERAAAVASLEEATPGPMPLPFDAPAPSYMAATLLDALVVLDDVDALGPNALDWSPLPIDRVQQAASLEDWLSLPGNGPQRVFLPGMHTLAERGGKAPRRRGAAPAGSELFFGSCSLMAAGAETVMLSRWRVGGQSTLDLVREFLQELPHTPAADAWQRSVQLAMESPVDPANELRVKTGRKPVELTAKHPFFWAGYLIVDSGWRPEDAAEQNISAEPALAPGPANAGQPAAGAPAQPPSTPPVPTPPAPGAETAPADDPLAPATASKAIEP